MDKTQKKLEDKKKITENWKHTLLPDQKQTITHFECNNKSSYGLKKTFHFPFLQRVHFQSKREKKTHAMQTKKHVYK